MVYVIAGVGVVVALMVVVVVAVVVESGEGFRKPMAACVDVGFSL